MRLNLMIFINTLFFICIISCKQIKQQKTFFREESLLRYLEEKTNLLEKEDFLLVLANTYCGGFEVERLQTIENDSLYNQSDNIFFLITKGGDAEYIEAAIEDPSQITYGEYNEMQRYGIALSNSYLLHIKNKKIIDWVKIKPSYLIEN